MLTKEKETEDEEKAYNEEEEQYEDGSLEYLIEEEESIFED